ncbi:hypothetical protein RZN25_16035 [Bacillaceae bacterium S4-13-56]
MPFVVAEWPASRLNHWRVLLQTRAIENQCFVIEAALIPTINFLDIL